tara:strand:+ start:661 stop:975 length:315 start_codon:yes stop_codon:yes gene_type:complete
MTNEMKLLMALCDAMGLEVETIYDSDRREISEVEGHMMIERSRFNDGDSVRLVMTSNRLSQPSCKRGANGSYFTELVQPTVEYKLTKKTRFDNTFTGQYKDNKK